MRNKIKRILKALKKEYPDAKGELNFIRPIDILVATILSAQCTDKQVNIVTQKLFKKYRKVSDYADANYAALKKEIKSIGFYKNKAKNIINAAKILMKKFKGKVPKTMEGLLLLPGVGRKTANIVLLNAYGISKGIAVDTHVKRLSKRLKLSDKNDPAKIEKDLLRIIPKKDWPKINILLITHGRKICRARNPMCSVCVLKNLPHHLCAAPK